MTGIAKFARYKLNTVFDGDSVVHTTSKSDLQTRQRKVEITTRWRRGTVIGSGGFAVVWREKDEESGDLRAVKIIPKPKINHRELDALVEVQDHPELFVVFFGWFEDRDSIYLAMEFIEYGDLGRYIKEHGMEAKALAKEIASQILEGLAVLHERGIFHRDIKPQNVLIASPSPIWVKISDFGISKRITGGALETRSGTISYQSPEQLGLLPSCFGTGRPYTTAVDIWAFGVVIHEVLTSEIPFVDTYQPTESIFSRNAGTNLDMQLLYQYCSGDLFPVERLRQHCVSEDGIDFVMSLMVVNPTNRVSARDALASQWLLGTAESGTPSAAGPLLDMGAAVSCSSGSYITLQSAQFAAPRLIADMGENVNMVPPLNPKPRTALQLAVEVGDIDSVKLLLDRGADPNVVSFRGSKTCTVLQGAVERGDIDFVRLLLDRGADPNRSTMDYRQTPLEMATDEGHVKMVILLLERGADARG